MQKGIRLRLGLELSYLHPLEYRVKVLGHICLNMFVEVILWPQSFHTHHPDIQLAVVLSITFTVDVHVE